jgi:hypothetical protein
VFRKIIKFLFYLVTFYIVAGFFLFPFLKSPLLNTVNKELNAEVTAQSIAFNPLLCSVTISQLQLDSQQKKKLLSIEKINLNIDPSYLLIGALKVKSFFITKPQISLIREKQGNFNFANILKESHPAQEPKKENKSSLNMRIIVDNITLERGELLFHDYTHKTPFAISLENIGFWLRDFDTKKLHKKSANLHFYAKLGDEGFVDLKSKIAGIEPIVINGNLDFAANKLYTEWRYVQDMLHLEVADGKLSFGAHFAYNSGQSDATQIKIDNMNICSLRIKVKNKAKELLTLQSLDINNTDILPMKQDVHIGSISLDGLAINAERYRNKKIDWVTYLQSKTTVKRKISQKETKKESASKPWKLYLDDLDLKKISLAFRDKAVAPAVTTKIHDLSVKAKAITLLGEKAFPYTIMLRLNKSGKCKIAGRVAHKELSLQTNAECSNLNIVHYRPYIDSAAKSQLQRYNIILQRALLDFNINLDLHKKKQAMQIALSKSKVDLKKLIVVKRRSKKRIVRFDNFTIAGLNFNNLKKSLHIQSVILQKPLVSVERKWNGKIDLTELVVAKKTAHKRKKRKKAKAKAKKSSSYRVKIDTIALKRGLVLLHDKSKELLKPQTQRLDHISFRVNNYDSKQGSWMRYSTFIRLNTKGKISAKGKVRVTPLTQRGSLSLKNIDLSAITPYLEKRSYLRVDDGRLSCKVYESYKPSKHYPDLHMRGNLDLESLFVSNSNDKDSALFSLNELRVKPFTLELFPNRLYIDELDVDAFYVAAKIDQNKTINFAKLMKKSKVITKAPKKRVAATKEQSNPFPVKIVKINVKNGSAEFQDLSLPIQFKTNIHDLNGALYAISSTPGDTTYVDIAGEVDKYGSTKLKGSVDSFNPKDYTDLNFNFKNLDLHSMSGYSASFAGYEIESGKLYLDLGYNILHSKLQATNNIMIKNIKLGKEIEGKDVHHLPLGFVIGLLEDSDGIIDIDLPIAGDVNSPDFKYGKVVWKTLGNLIASAVTSPFRFLGSMMGISGDTLEFVAFEYGHTNITPPQREKLDKIAKMMKKRPKILLELSGTYDEVGDLYALKQKKLVAMVMKISGNENKQNAKTTLNSDILEEVYNELRDDDGIDQLKTKLHKKYKDKNAFQRAYQNALLRLATKVQHVDPKELNALAKKRAYMIKTYLIKEVSIAPNRVVMGNIKKVKENSKLLKMKLNIKVQSKVK